MKVLGIETSCDETSAAIILGQETRDKQGAKKSHISYHMSHVTILSNIISSQIDLHAKYGGVVPEVAARAHIENMIPAIKASLKKAQCDLNNIDSIAVTIGPGLIGSLLVGVNTAKALAYALDKPIIGINHLEGHIYANFINENQNETIFPLLCLIVSGGHTSLVLMKEHLKYKILGQTLDDAAGEAFDKVGKLLGLPYPGGPNIEKAAMLGNSSAFDFPRAMLDRKDYNFSFSGLKTAVLYKIKDQKFLPRQSALPSGRQTGKFKNNKRIINDVAASFQQAATDVLVKKTIKASKEHKVRTVMLAGGVAANETLQKQLYSKLKTHNEELKFLVPPKILCTDNAAMIAAAGYFHALKKDFTPRQKINANSNLQLT